MRLCKRRSRGGQEELWKFAVADKCMAQSKAFDSRLLDLKISAMETIVTAIRVRLVAQECGVAAY